MMKINARGKFEKIEITQETLEQRQERLDIVENENLNRKLLEEKPIGNLVDKGNSPENVKFEDVFKEDNPPEPVKSEIDLKLKKTPGTRFQKKKEKKIEDQITVKEMIRKLENIGGKLTAPGEKGEKDIGKRNEFEKKTSPASTPIRVRKIKRGGGNSAKKTSRKKNEKKYLDRASQLITFPISHVLL